MGLDSVEIVLSAEEMFDIEISDEAAGRMQTVGDMHEFVMSELVRLERPNINRDIVYDLLRNIICMQLGVKREDVVPGARFVQDLGMD